MNKTLKTGTVLLLLASTFCFTGCIDIYQHISKNKTGKTDMYLQISFSKALVAMANGFSGDQESFDYKDWLDNNGGFSSLDTAGIPNLEKGKIDSETDFGYFIRASYPAQRNEVNQDASFFPQQIGNKIVICLNFKSDSEDDQNSESNQMANAMLSSAKYRLSISKSYAPKVSKITLEDDDIIRKINFTDMSDEYLVDIPIMYLLHKNTQLSIE